MKMKAIYKLYWSAKRAGIHAAKVDAKTSAGFVALSKHLVDNPFDMRYNHACKMAFKVFEMREDEDADNVEFLRSLTSGEPLYYIITERDCDGCESTWSQKFSGYAALKRWYRDNRDNAEGPLWMRRCSHKDYAEFTTVQRDLYAEMMGY